LRKAELSNSRSAMLATVGWYWPTLVGTFNSDDVTTTDPIDAMVQADPQWWAQFVLLCGVIEGIKYRGELDGKSYTGDGPAVIDWAKQWDKLDAKQKENMRVAELKNGRLAMIGIASFVSAHYIEGSVPFPGL
jgi:light-harvesting complex I chlorophyll a/b binding protein 1